MCFSSTVSFAASAVLAIGGVVAMKKVTAPKQYLFAAIPFIFSLQQFAEGILWMSFSHYAFENFRIASTVAFLIVAQVVWPVWVPLSFLRMERKSARKKYLRVFLWVGALFSSYIIYCLFSYSYQAYPESDHMKYDLDFPLNGSFLAALFYFVPTVLSCVVSSAKRSTLLGTVIFGSYIMSRIFYEGFSISVWCFFSAVISLMIIYIVLLEGQPKARQVPARGTHVMEG